MAEIYFQRVQLELLVTHEIWLEYQLKHIKVMENALCL